MEQSIKRIYVKDKNNTNIKNTEKQNVRSFAVKNALFAVAALIAACIIIGVYSFQNIRERMDRLIEDKVLSIAESTASFIDGDIITSFKPGEEDSASYLEYLLICRDIAERTGTKYIYVLDNTESGEIRFLLDTDAETAKVIGDIFDSFDISELQGVFRGHSYVTPEPYEDEFGVFKSGYSPIRDRSGNVTAIIGVDYDITMFQKDLQSVMITYILICVLIVSVMVIIIIIYNILAYGRIKSRLTHSLASISSFLSDVKKSVRDFENGSNLLADSSDSSSLEIQSISAALEQTSATIQITGEHTQKATEYFSEASSELSEGTGKMTELNASIGNIKNSSEEISQIIGIINNIAKQTKILALNAEVEAARVGELGKGFAVVAREVGTLAQNSEDAAKNINEIILKNIEFTKKAVSDTNEVSAILETVDKKNDNLSKIIREVSLASIEQSRGVDIILNSVASLKNSSSDNTQFAGEIKSSAGSLADMTENLNRHVTSIHGVIGGKVAAV